jgi:hypothetical protein
LQAGQLRLALGSQARNIVSGWFLVLIEQKVAIQRLQASTANSRTPGAAIKAGF